MIDVAAITSAVYARAATDAAGADVRALLGAGAGSVVHVEDLRVEGLTLAQIPRRPLIALRRGVGPQVDRVVWRPIYTWYIYDDIAIGYGRIEQIIGVLGASYYAADLTATTTRIGEVEASALGAQLRDTQLGLLMELLTLTVGAV